MNKMNCGDLGTVPDQYGQIIVDEGHHLSAFSFEAILKQVKARYVVGLTATPIRRDGHQRSSSCSAVPSATAPRKRPTPTTGETGRSPCRHAVGAV
jgi:superfamily II DNA or RNA helicase